MNKFFTVAITAVMSVITLYAQTPDEIISRMESEFNKHRSEGVIMTMDMKIIIIGNISSTMMALGDKSYSRTSDGSTVVWTDGPTSWSYDAAKNQITINSSNKDTGNGADADMFSGITSGYNVKLIKETDQAWHFKCKRAKGNKDAIKKMNLVVDKKTYYPVSMSTKGILASVTFKDVSFGVTDDQVTYNPAAYPTATVIDNR